MASEPTRKPPRPDWVLPLVIVIVIVAFMLITVALFGPDIPGPG